MVALVGIWVLVLTNTSEVVVEIKITTVIISSSPFLTTYVCRGFIRFIIGALLGIRGIIIFNLCTIDGKYSRVNTTIC